MSWPKEIPYERYPSDLTDEEWEIVKPLLEKLDPYTTGRPRKVDLREVLNAIFTSIRRVVHGAICQHVFPLPVWSATTITSGLTATF